MRIGVTLEDNKGLESTVSAHFGQCKYFLIAEIENNAIKSSHVVQNTAEHGGGGCVAVNEIMKYSVTHVIAGGMGMGAQQKFAVAGVKVCGVQGGTAKAAIESMLKKTLGGLGACAGHGDQGDCH